MEGKELKELLEKRGISHLGLLINNRFDSTDLLVNGISKPGFIFISRFPSALAKFILTHDDYKGCKLIILNSSILWKEEVTRIYYPINPKNKQSVGFETIFNERTFERLFKSGIKFEKLDGTIDYFKRSDDLPDSFTTVSSACIKWCDKIKGKYIDGIFDVGVLQETEFFDEIVGNDENKEKYKPKKIIKEEKHNFDDDKIVNSYLEGSTFRNCSTTSVKKRTHHYFGMDLGYLVDLDEDEIFAHLNKIID